MTLVDESIAPETAVLAELEGDKIKIDAGFRDRDLIKMVPGHNWDRVNRQWYVRKSWAAAVQLRAVFGDRIIAGPDLTAWTQEQYHWHIQPALQLRDAKVVSPEVQKYLGIENAPLYDVQKAGVAFLVYAQHALIGDEVGSGKTRQIIFALEAKDAYPAVIVAPKSVKDSWVEEYQAVAPHRKVVNIRGGAAQRRKLLSEPADVYVIHWDIVRLHSRVAGYGNIKLTDEEKEPKELNFIKKKAVVVDEAHRSDRHARRAVRRRRLAAAAVHQAERLPE
jgi:hypothetical protein